jgi:nucleotide-binding universal stress UspA family protein
MRFSVPCSVGRLESECGARRGVGDWTRRKDVSNATSRGANRRRTNRDGGRTRPAPGSPRPSTPGGPLIAVAFDGGPAAWTALERAAALARSLGGTVTILHAAEPALPSVGAVGEALRAIEAARADGAALLARAGGALGSGVPWTVEVLGGEPARAVSARAAELGAEVVVVGSSGRGALARLLGGSVSRAIVERAAGPVLVVPARAAGAPDRAVPTGPAFRDPGPAAGAAGALSARAA